MAESSIPAAVDHHTGNHFLLHLGRVSRAESGCFRRRPKLPLAVAARRDPLELATCSASAAARASFAKDGHHISSAFQAVPAAVRIPDADSGAAALHVPFTARLLAHLHAAPYNMTMVCDHGREVSIED
jgi:hypothetical protein